MPVYFLAKLYLSFSLNVSEQNLLPRELLDFGLLTFTQLLDQVEYQRQNIYLYVP